MKENLNALVEIYNALLRVHTNGEDSFLMTDCMRAFRKVIEDISKQDSSKEG